MMNLNRGIGSCALLHCVQTSMEQSICATCSTLVLLRRHINTNRSIDKELHMYRQPLNKNDLLDHISRNILYNKDGLVAVNKPYGVGKKVPDSSKVAKFTVPSPINNLFLDSLLPEVAAITGHSSLKIAKISERYTSGVLILTGNEEAERRVDRSIKLSKGRVAFMDTFLVVSQGRPLSSKGEVKVGITIDTKANHKRKLPILVDKWSSNDLKLNRVRTSIVKHTELAHSPLASLSQVSITCTRWHCLRLYFATRLLSPVLGDSIYSSRVNNVLGVPLLIDHWSDVANSPKNLPSDILKALELTSKDTPLVPAHIHLSEVTLPKYNQGQDLTVYAPLLPMYVWTCNQLGINTDSRPQLKESSRV